MQNGLAKGAALRSGSLIYRIFLRFTIRGSTARDGGSILRQARKAQNLTQVFQDIRARADEAFATALAEMPPGFPGALAASVQCGFQLRLPRLRTDGDQRFGTLIRSKPRRLRCPSRAESQVVWPIGWQGPTAGNRRSDPALAPADSLRQAVAFPSIGTGDRRFSQRVRRVMRRRSMNGASKT